MPAEGSKGVLQGLTIIEMAGLGPAPFCGMMLADHGARVIRVGRIGERIERANILNRSRETLAVDLKSAPGREVVRALAAKADGLIEGFRPGTMERMGLGPDDLRPANPALVYGRMTGWGQSGPLAHTAGHDINYIAIAGALHPMGRSGQPPAPPLNLVGDFGAGGMMLAFGMVAGLLSASRTGRGQVIDCAMVDGSALLMSMMWAMKAAGRWGGGRGENLLDGGAYFYDSYITADGGYVAVGSLEPQFFRILVDRLGLSDDPDFSQMDRARWGAARAKLTALFLTRTRDEWVALFEGSDACFSPILSMEEALTNPHNVSRGLFAEHGGVTQPVPAPRFSDAAPVTPAMPDPDRSDARRLLEECGVSADDVEAWIAAGHLR